MEREQYRHGGGIVGLRRLVKNYSGAFEFDLLDRGYRLTQSSVVHVSAPGWPLDWHELYVLASGFARDDRCHLHQAIDPDWEWRTVPAFLAASVLQAVQGANWQRSGSKGSPPQLLTPELLRGNTGVKNRAGVESGRRKGKGAGVGVRSSADFAKVKEAMAARRAKALSRS